MRIPDQRLPGPAVSGRYHVLGAPGHGPFGAAVKLTSMADYRAAFGPRTAETTALYDDLAVFFAEGGGEAYVTRVAEDATLEEIAEALDATSEHTRGGCVAAPGYPAQVYGPTLIRHAARTSKLALLSMGVAATAQDAADTAAFLTDVEGSDHAGLFWPWVVTPTVEGATRPAPPTGFVAAARARTHAATGFWSHPAGQVSLARTVRSLAHPSDRAGAWAAADHRVSALATTRNGVELYGWWSLAGDRANFPHLTTRDLLNNTALELVDRYGALRAAPWGTVERFVSQVRTTTRAVCATLVARGALTPNPAEDLMSADPGYLLSVDYDARRHLVVVEVALRPLQYARVVGTELIRVPLHIPLDSSEVLLGRSTL